MSDLVNLIYAANALICLLFGLHIVLLGQTQTRSTQILGFNYLLYGLQYLLGILLFLWQWQPAFYIRPVIAMIIGPSYYFYYYSVVNKESLWQAQHFLHLIPALGMLALLLSESFYFISPDYLVLTSFSIYTLSILAIIVKGPSHLQHLGKSAKNAFHWLCVLAIYIVIGTLTEFAIYFEIQQGVKPTSSNSLLIGSLIFLLTNTTIVFLSLRQSPLVEWMFVLAAKQLQKYKGSGLSQEEREAIFAKWQILNEKDKLFMQEGGITLLEAAKLLHVPSRHLSEAINSCYQASFSQYLNDCRIKKASQLMLDDPSMQITTIMYEVGFNSKSGFNKEFLKTTGISPSKFREKYLNKPNTP